MPIVIPVPIPTAPAVPQRNDPATFEERNDAAAEYQFETLPAAIDQQSQATYQNALAAKESAEAAEQSRQAANGTGEAAAEQVALAADEVQHAADYADDSAASAAASEASHQAAMAVAAAFGDAAGLPSLTGKARQALMVNAQGTGEEWRHADSITRTERMSAITLTAADKAGWIEITDGTFAQAFAAFSALGAGWWCYIQNSGTGNLTIPSSDGRTNWIMYPGEMRLFQCDGVELRSIVLNAFYKVFALSGNFIKPPGYVDFGFLLWSGGGSAGVATAGSSLNTATGGGGAACAAGVIPASALAEVEPVTIGAGGFGKVGAGNGNAGGVSNFAGISPASGGGGAAVVNGSTAPAGTAGLIAAPPAVQVFPGLSRGNQSIGTPNSADTLTYLGGGAGANLWINNKSGVGRSLLGGDGSEAVTGSSTDILFGQAPQIPGAGSGAVYNGGAGSAASADGARGEFRIWGVI